MTVKGKRLLETRYTQRVASMKHANKKHANRDDQRLFRIIAAEDKAICQSHHTTQRSTGMQVGSLLSYRLPQHAQDFC